MRQSGSIRPIQRGLPCVDAVDSNPFNTMRDGSPDDASSDAKQPSRWGNLLIGLVLGGVIGAGALYVTKVDPSLLSKGASVASSPFAIHYGPKSKTRSPNAVMPVLK